MRCDLSSNPLEEDCLLNGGVALSQESLKLELVEFETSSHLLHLSGVCTAFIEIKGVLLVGFNLGVVLIA